MSQYATLSACAAMSEAAQRRLRRPRTRGAFAPIDAARRQLGLLAVADGAGQAHVSWLIDLGSTTIEDARFLAFGAAASHPVADAFTELVRGRSVEDACRLSAEQVESLLRDDPATPAFGEAGLAPLAFLDELQSRALAALPAVKLLPKPEERQVYQRKRKQDWDANDQRWLPLSLLAKIAKVDAAAARVLSERAKDGASASIDGLHDDFRVVIRFEGVPPEQGEMLAAFLRDALRAELHPGIDVEVAA